MTNIELVIKIDEETLQDLYDSRYVSPHIKEALRNGTPLPKGHGVLKDTDVMINKLCTHEASELFGSVTCAEILDFINDEKPIIDADKDMDNELER